MVTRYLLYDSLLEMSTKSHHALNSLYRRFTYECKHFAANQNEMEKLSNAYFRYGDLLHEQARISDRILRIFGVLGQFSPDTSEKLADGIRRTLALPPTEPINSHDVRKGLKLWEIFELFLSSVDNKATISDFKDFLFQLDINECSERVSGQAINSAIKTHPELFEETSENGQKFIVLKSSL